MTAQSEIAKMADPRNYVGGDVHAPQRYELRIDGKTVEQSTTTPELLWKARRAVNGKPDVRAEVVAVSGFGFHASFSDAVLHDWERA